MIGKTFGKLLVIRKHLVNKNRKQQWVCKCICGNFIVTPTTSALRNGQTQSCGCLNRERLKARKIKTHGHARGGTTTPTYQSWRAMHQRCECPKNKDYKHYGGRGIKVCKEWGTFEQFLLDMSCRPSLDFSLDRIDSNKDYTPKNCRWITKSENSKRIRKDKVYKIIKNCLNCIIKFESYIKQEQKFCSHSCSTEYRNKIFRKEVGLHVN